jgi:hypothetical protein
MSPFRLETRSSVPSASLPAAMEQGRNKAETSGSTDAYCPITVGSGYNGLRGKSRGVKRG